jgi:hypothetical protein
MDPDDHAMLLTMATKMAALSGYDVGQSSSGEVHVGNQVDWMYATYRIMSFTVEMGDAFHMPDEAIPTETGRNMEAAYYATEQAAMLEKADDDRAPTLLPDTAMCMTPP